MSEPAYTRITYDVTMAAARAVLAASPDATFIYVSGAGTDTSESGRAMWARVKGHTENDLLSMSPKAYMFRPGIILPVHGVTSKTPLYRGIYTGLRPLEPAAAPGSVRHHVGAASAGRCSPSRKHGATAHVLDNKQINAATE